MPDGFTTGARAIAAIATNTFREAVRNRIFGALVAVAVGVVLFSVVLGAMSLHNEVRVARDVSLFASTVFSMVVTIYVTINLFRTEIERRTIYTILSKPVRRWQFLLGKFVGIAALLVAILALLFGASTAVILYQGGELTAALGWAFVCIYLQLLVLASLTLLLASYSSPLLAGMLSAGLFVLGHLHGRLHSVQSYFDSPTIGRIVDVVEVIAPDLSSLNLSTEVVHGMSIPAWYLLDATWYAASYSAIVLLAAIVVFGHRDLD